ncbi:MAG: YicC family protein [Deltaproteobacteria bacterium RBG_16_48_10]|nr:MAG: YicC family protein [Deltaproteobacteria bacterium RBG_16_48_10]
MLKSMTGFGRGEGEMTLGKMVVEIRSINHRYCDISLKLPKRFSPLEARIKEMIRAEVSRGRIDVTLKLDAKGEGKLQFDVDLSLAEQYYKALQLLKETFQIQGEITLEHLAEAKDLITAKEEVEDVEPYWQEMVPILKQSIKDMDRMKRAEGISLGKDLRQRLDLISRFLSEIQTRFPLTLIAYQERFKERLRMLLQGSELDPSRFQQEIAFWVERTDITEEMVRAESHLTQFRALLESDESTGRKMDFLLQEIHREANTIGSKVNDAEISQRVVEIKGELEKIREQVQNIE